MKITVLGCGSSGGVPQIGNDWGACNPADSRNRRLRSSILVEEGGVSLLVDTSPDLREQLLAHNVRRLDAVFYTHAHGDHCHGIDELRSINWLIQSACIRKKMCWILGLIPVPCRLRQSVRFPRTLSAKRKTKRALGFITYMYLPEHCLARKRSKIVL